MRKAVLSVVSFEVECPYCMRLVEYPYTGSQIWPIFDGDIPTGIVAGKEYECSECGEKFLLPHRVTRTLLPEK